MLLIHLFFWTSRHPATQQTANIKPVHLSSQVPWEKLGNLTDQPIVGEVTENTGEIK